MTKSSTGQPYEHPENKFLRTFPGAANFSRRLRKRIKTVREMSESGMDRYVLGLMKYLDEGRLSEEEIASLPVQEVIRVAEALTDEEIKRITDTFNP